MKRILSIFSLLALCCYASTVWALEASIDFSNLELSHATDMTTSNRTIKDDSGNVIATISWSKGENSTNMPKFFTTKVGNISGSENFVRHYAKNTITITSAKGVSISKMSFFIYSNESGTFTASTGTYTQNVKGTNATGSAVWAGTIANGDSVTFTVSSKSGTQVGIRKITVTYNTSITKTKTSVSFSKSSYSFEVNSDEANSFTGQTASVKDADGNTVEGAAVTYTSSNEDLASVSNDGTVTLVKNKTGNATITATYAGNDSYEGSSASYTITVSGSSKPIAETDTYAIRFTFEPTSISGGTLTNAPDGTTASFTNTYTGLVTQLYKNKSNEHKEGVQVTKDHSMTLTLTNLPVGYKIDSISLSVHVNQKEGCGKVTASLSSNIFSDDFYISNSNCGYEKWTTVPVTLKSNPTITSAEDVLTINIAASENSAYCDKFIIRLVPAEDVPTITLASTATNWGTVCLPYTARAVTGTTLYTVAGSSDEGILVEPKGDGILVAGTPYIFKAEGNGSFYRASNDSVSEAVAGANNLVGILADKTLTGSDVAGIYILATSDGIWHCMGEGATVNFKAHRAYLSALPEKISSTAKPRLSVIGTDGLSAIRGVDSSLHSAAPKAIYTLAGQRVSSMEKGGIYIVDGKKVFIK